MPKFQGFQGFSRFVRTLVPIDTNKKGLKNRCQLSQFVNIGCQNYKKMHEKQQCHNAAEYHKEACFVAECIKQRFEKPESTIKAQIDCDLKSRYYIYIDMF